MTDANAQGEHVLAADYDPSHDRREDEHKRFGVPPHPQPAAEVVESEEFEEVEEVEEDDIDDMFAVDKPEKKVKKIRRKVTVRIPTRLFRTDSDVTTETCRTCAYYDYTGLSVGPGRLLHDRLGRAARRRHVSGLLVSWQRHVRECRACAYTAGPGHRSGGCHQARSVAGVHVRSTCLLDDSLSRRLGFRM